MALLRAFYAPTRALPILLMGTGTTVITTR